MNGNQVDRFGPDGDDGQTCYRRHRITVELALEKMAAGETEDQILEAHPRLTREGIRVALAFAAETLRADVIYPMSEVAH